jgi:hypothetical protein
VLLTPDPWGVFLQAPHRFDDLPDDPFVPPSTRP